MTTQPEALRLADELENMTCLWSPSVNRARVDKATAELRRLHPYEPAYKAWHEKTEWVQTTARPGEFGMHRADVMRQRLEQAEAQRDALLEALKLARPYINPNTPYGYHAEVKAAAAIKAVEGEKT